MCAILIAAGLSCEQIPQLGRPKSCFANDCALSLSLYDTVYRASVRPARTSRGGIERRLRIVTTQERHSDPGVRFDRVVVTVSYLQLDRVETELTPADRVLDVCQVEHPDVGFYRYLYNTVGERWLWWRRRMTSDRDLQAHLNKDVTKIYAFYRNGQPYGFFELDLSPYPDIDLAYFGLMPFAIGQRLGASALRLALNAAWELTPRAITVNTCTADHPSAMAAYLRAGFRLLETKSDEWLIPDNIGLSVPEQLRQPPPQVDGLAM
jgi:RimJ/RimL family protein N-acetyltransferase